MKICVVGHGRHGKDTACNILRDYYGLTFVSSSWFVGERAVRPYLKKLGIEYPTMQSCYNDRHTSAWMRARWYDAICQYNQSDPARHGKELFAEHDIYCGLRNIAEFLALKKAKVFDFSIWIDRSQHVEPEHVTSITIKPRDADCIVDNNGTMEELKAGLIATVEHYKSFLS